MRPGRLNSRIWDSIKAELAKSLPRQAIVTRPDGNGVWCRTTPVASGDEPSWYPSTVAGVPAGTSGWVITIGGGKGLFVATNIFQPVTKWIRGSGTTSGNTAGTYPHATAALTFSGLNPARSYHVSAAVGIQSTGTTIRGLRPVFQAIGATTVNSDAMAQAAELNNQVLFDTSEADLYPTAGGVITVRPAFTWTSGTISANAMSITATIS